MKLADYAAALSRIVAMPKTTEDDAYQAGRDSIINGTSETNCHFRFFMRPELAAAWSRGSKEARNES
jgi:hypothetical protein